MKIDINISNNRLFNDVALIVDSEQFLKAIKVLRQKYKIIPPFSMGKYRKWDFHIYKDDSIGKSLKREIESFRRDFDLPHSFTPVITKALLLNMIREDDYSPAYLEMFDVKAESNGEILDAKYAIVLSPNVTNSDVLKAVQKYRDELGNIKNLSKYQYLPSFSINMIGKKSALQNHRVWYWLEKEGMAIEDIWLESVENCPMHTSNKLNLNKDSCTCGKEIYKKGRHSKSGTSFTKDTVSKGVKNYSSLLQKSRNF